MSGALLLGLTGGIGSGKSTVAQMMAKRGAAIVDADAIARRATAPGGAAIAPIATTFGAELITPEGAMDRARMRALVFADPGAKQRLEAIIHPLIGQETDQQARQAIERGARTVVFDVPLLVESGARWRHKVHRVLVVDCTEETQVARVMARNGLSRREVEGIIATQATRARRLASADMVIHNERLSLATLQAELTQLADHFGL